MRTTLRSALMLAVLHCAAPSSANAAILFDFAPPFPAIVDQQNLLFNDPSLTLSGMTVEGYVTSPHELFDITGVEQLVANGGQARVHATDSGFTYLLFEGQDANVAFAAFEANLTVFKPTGPGGPVSGQVNVTVTDTSGASVSQSYAVNSSGNNFFNLGTSDGQLIRSILLESSVVLSDIRQIRLGGVQEFDVEGGSVPEPGVLGLLGLGMFFAASKIRRKK